MTPTTTHQPSAATRLGLLMAAVLALAAPLAGADDDRRGGRDRRPPPPPPPGKLSFEPSRLVLDSPCGSKPRRPNSVTGRLSLRNTGGSTLRLFNTTITSGNQFFSIVSNQCRVGLSLRPNEHCHITVRFTPDGTAWDKNGSLTVNSTVGGKTVQLLGRCRPQVST